MTKTREEIILPPRIVKAFAGVRGRVKAAVAVQPPSVSLAEALAQVRMFQQASGTKK